MSTTILFAATQNTYSIHSLRTLNSPTADILPTHSNDGEFIQHADYAVTSAVVGDA